MATKNIAGITAKLGLDVTGVTSALKQIETKSKAIAKEMAEVDKSLKFNPESVVLAAQKQELQILSHVNEVAPYLAEKLDALVKKYDFLTAHRGMGLMRGLVCTLPVGQVASKALENGLIVITAGSDVLRFVPPLVITKDDVDEMILRLEKTFSDCH